MKVKLEPRTESHVLMKVKVKLSIKTIIILSLDKKSCPLKYSCCCLIRLPPSHLSKSPVIVPSSCHTLDSSCLKGCVSVVASLKMIARRVGKKNLLKKLDYSLVRLEKVEFLPLKFDEDIIFKLSLAGPCASQS